MECHTNKCLSAREVFSRRFGLPVQAFCLFLGLLGPLSASIVYFLIGSCLAAVDPNSEAPLPTKGKDQRNVALEVASGACVANSVASFLFS